eukprot:gene24835-17065_t
MSHGSDNTGLPGSYGDCDMHGTAVEGAVEGAAAAATAAASAAAAYQVQGAYRSLSRSLAVHT